MTPNKLNLKLDESNSANLPYSLSMLRGDTHMIDTKRYVSLTVMNKYSLLKMGAYFNQTKNLIGYLNDIEENTKIRIVAELDKENYEWTITLTKVKQNKKEI